MFTFEIKINGAMIAHIYGNNISDLPGGKCKYKYEYYEVEKRKVLNGEVTHLRSSGIMSLVSLILKDVENVKSLQNS